MPELRTKFTASRINKDHEILGTISRQELMTTEIAKLQERSEAYLKGKRVEFNTDTSFFECVQNPARLSGFITV